MDQDDHDGICFCHGAELSERQLARYFIHGNRPGVTVMLVDGPEHRHIAATHDDRSDAGARSCFHIARTKCFPPARLRSSSRRCGRRAGRGW